MADPTHDEYQLSIPLSHCKHSQKQTAAITHQQSKFDDKAVMAYSLIYGKKHKTLLICLAKESCERIIYTVSQKKQSKLFLPELRMSTNFDNYWHKDGQDSRTV